MNPFGDWRFWLPVSASLFLVFGHLIYSAVCPFIATERGHSICVLSSEVLLDLGSGASALNDAISDAGVR
jgi:hypothetical protein